MIVSAGPTASNYVHAWGDRVTGAVKPQKHTSCLLTCDQGFFVKNA